MVIFLSSRWPRSDKVCGQRNVIEGKTATIRGIFLICPLICPFMWLLCISACYLFREVLHCFVRNKRRSGNRRRKPKRSWKRKRFDRWHCVLFLGTTLLFKQFTRSPSLEIYLTRANLRYPDASYLPWHNFHISRELFRSALEKVSRASLCFSIRNLFSSFIHWCFFFFRLQRKQKLEFPRGKCLNTKQTSILNLMNR